MAKYASTGTLLKYEDPDNAGTFITVAQAKDFSGPDRSVNNTDVTTHDSTNGYAENLPTIKQGGTIDFDLEFDPEDAASQAELTTLFEAKTVLAWYLVFPTTNSARLEFSGHVSSIGVSAPVDGSLQAPVSIQTTGKITLNSSPS